MSSLATQREKARSSCLEYEIQQVPDKADKVVHYFLLFYGIKRQISAQL